jgi:hypothetical protein
MILNLLRIVEIKKVDYSNKYILAKKSIDVYWSYNKEVLYLRKKFFFVKNLIIRDRENVLMCGYIVSTFNFGIFMIQFFC